MNIFFTSDHHFGHANILKHEDEKRRDQNGARFKSIDHMNEHLVEQWNEVVSFRDRVYCLGDFSFSQASTEKVLPRMNGEKILICGNHDPFFKRMHMPSSAKQHQEAHEDARLVGFASVHLEMEIEISSGVVARLSHFPYFPAKTKDIQDHELRYPDIRPQAGLESVLLHGHVHSQWRERQDKGLPLMVNVGVDMWGMRPVPASSVVQLLMRHGIVSSPKSGLFPS